MRIPVLKTIVILALFSKAYTQTDSTSINYDS